MVIWAVGKIHPFKVRKDNTTPTVSIIIPAYNEAKSVEQKIVNTMALDYPENKREILIGSDGSTDETAILAGKFVNDGVQFLDFKANRGKTAVQNDLVARSTGEILVFTDAASFLPPDAVKKTVRNFADDRVGCVAGRMRFVATDSNLTTQSQGLYWRYEVKIREMESKLGSLVGVDGPLYAVRRDCYVPLEHNVISDLLTPLLVLEQGKKVVLESEALVDEDPTLKSGQEFATRRRITLRGLVGLSTYTSLLNPLRDPMLSFQVFFHKVLRWFVGPLVILNVLACSALSGHWFFISMLGLYASFFLAAALGWFTERQGVKVRALTVPYYFSLVNLAATMGIVDFFRKKQAITWKPVRH
jgi:cellulose synthase/poly-beta-1,6-N-acetylglucosamine synthase-like glycosyltransferase